ncbi:MAG: hypothetical protein ACREFD_19010 [Stellaceae bacterium]
MPIVPAEAQEMITITFGNERPEPRSIGARDVSDSVEIVRASDDAPPPLPALGRQGSR